jgi:DNA-binding transcriptional regulator YhcF (GntR family)
MADSQPSDELLGHLQISPTSGIPIYVQIKTQLEYAIATGRIPPNVQLPSVRTAATHLNVAVDTVRQAYDALEHQGLVETRRGLGTFTCLPAGRKGVSPTDNSARLLPHVDQFLIDVLHQGHSGLAVLRTIEHRMAMLERGPLVAFVGVRPSTQRYADELSKVLMQGIPPVRGIAIEELRQKSQTVGTVLESTTHVVTLVFHIREVDDLLSHLPVRVLPLVSMLERSVVQAIAQLPAQAHPLLVCREASRPIYEEMIKAQRPAEEPLLFACDNSSSEIIDLSQQSTVVLHTTVAKSVVEKAVSPKLPRIELRHTATRASLKQVSEIITADWELALSLQHAITSAR